MNPIKKFGIFSSSVNPNEIGKTVEGGILAVSTIIIFLAHQFGLNLVDTQVSELAVTIGSIVSTGFILFGLIRKVVVFLSTPKNIDVTPPTVQVAPTESLPPLTE